LARRNLTSTRASKSSTTDTKNKKPSFYTVIERISVVIGLIAIAPLTRIWDRFWWIRVLFVLIVMAVLVAATYDLLPRWSRRWPVGVGVLATLVTAAAVLPALGDEQPRPAPDTAGRATIASPRNGEPQSLIVREAGGYTDGFTASGTCMVPRGYRAVIVSRANRGPGYWLLSDGILNDCVDDSATHQWTAARVDPSWPGMELELPITIGVVIVRKEVADQAQIQKAAGEPLNLPQPSATALTIVSRIQNGSTSPRAGESSTPRSRPSPSR
jgi:hypothetical protein